MKIRYYQVVFLLATLFLAVALVHSSRAVDSDQTAKSKDNAAQNQATSSEKDVAQDSDENDSDKPKLTYTYNADIRPIIAENCFACHGPDSASRKAELRLDKRDDAISAKAIIP